MPMGRAGVSEPDVAVDRRTLLLWWAVLACLGLCAAALTCFPLLRITTPVSLNYNEGWNAYRDQMAANGIPLYAEPPGGSITNYPFLSYHLVGLLSQVYGNVTVTGRTIALASLLATAVLIAAIALQLAGSWRTGLYAGLCFFVWLEAYSPDRRAMNDPHLLGLALSTFGLYAAIHRRRRLGWLAISAIAFAATVFTKNNLLAFPAVVALSLLLQRRWLDFLLWTVTGIVAAATLVYLTFRFDGAYFADHLLSARPYDIVGGIAANLDFASWFYVPAVIALGSLLWAERSSERTIAVGLLVVTWAIEAAFAFGSGVDSNIFFDVIAALALGTALGLSRLEQIALQARWGRGAYAVLVVLPALTGVVHVPRQVNSDLKSWHQLPRLREAAVRGVEVLDGVAGPVLCENILLCFEAGKPMGPDANFIQGQVRLGRMSEGVLLSQIEARYYGAVEIGEEASRADCPRECAAAIFACVHGSSLRSLPAYPADRPFFDFRAALRVARQSTTCDGDRRHQPILS